MLFSDIKFPADIIKYYITYSYIKNNEFLMMLKIGLILVFPINNRYHLQE